MRNKPENLNNHLFEQLERLNDPDLKDEELTTEINRSKAIISVAQAIINNHNSMLDTARFLENSGYVNTLKSETLEILGVEKGEAECLEKSKNAYICIQKDRISTPKSRSSSY